MDERGAFPRTYRHNDDKARGYVRVKQIVAESSFKHEDHFEAREIAWKTGHAVTQNKKRTERKRASSATHRWNTLGYNRPSCF